jgi:hypothetical protein
MPQDRDRYRIIGQQWKTKGEAILNSALSPKALREPSARGIWGLRSCRSLFLFSQERPETGTYWLLRLP